MKKQFQSLFSSQWERYFPGCELPVACWYSDAPDGADFGASKPGAKGYTCFYSLLAAVRKGRSRAFNQDNLSCSGAVANLGFGGRRTEADALESARYIADVERIKKTREHALGMVSSNPPLAAQGRYLVCKRWDKLGAGDSPQMVVFMCGADAISGLHALANYDTFDACGVVAPSGAGCETLVGAAMKQLASDAPRAVLGSFDPPVRACMKKHWLSMSVPWPRFEAMVENMDECFLHTPLWDGIRRRMAKA